MSSQIVYQKNGSIEIRFEYDVVFISQLKDEIPGWARSYKPATRAWTIELAYRDEAIRLMRNRFGHVAIWGEPGGNLNDTACKCDSAHRALKVCQDAPPEVVKAAYRALSKINHPDSGGDHQQMIQLTEAFERVTGGVR